MINIARRIEEIFKRQDFIDFIRDRNVVFLKPNLCSIYPPPSTTRIETILAVVKNLRSTGAKRKIMLVESDQSTKTMEEKMERVGWVEPLSKSISGVDECINLTNQNRSLKTTRNTGIINLPVIKTTYIPFVRFTAAIKNLFGLIPDPEKARYHKRMIEFLKVLKSHYSQSVYTIIDGKYCMDGPGAPLKGNTIEFPQFYVAGRNLDEVDTLVCRICGFDPTSVGYLRPVSPKISREDKELFNRLVESHSKYENFESSHFTIARRVVFEVLPSDTDGWMMRRIRRTLGR